MEKTNDFENYVNKYYIIFDNYPLKLISPEIEKNFSESYFEQIRLYYFPK